LNSGRKTDDFITDKDFVVKQRMFNEIFSTGYKTYTEMQQHKYNSVASDKDVAMSAICFEPGRTVGFLHDSVDGKKRLIDQVDAMINVKPVMPICLRSDMLDQVPVGNYTEDVRRL